MDEGGFEPPLLKKILARIRNYHSAIRLLDRIEPISLHSQYKILPIKLQVNIYEDSRIEPTILILKTNALPFKLYPNYYFIPDVGMNLHFRLKRLLFCH
jgi:hypothetical protein